MRFTGRGSIVGWRVRGNHDPGSGNHNEDPRLQIWRPVSPGASTYEIAHELSLLAPNGETLSTQVVPNVHEHSLSIARRVEPGDIFGMFLSRTNGGRSRLDIFFEGSSSPEVQYYRYTGTLTEFSGDGGTSTGKPLVALQVVCDGM
jgi:hypothetical protein